ncbi:hypothetical protein IL306_007121 [Fusarium sp. DS 682]|nr:hypothetical protein IL306_007121 [Fusarium sp. DS 682]
MAHSSSMEMASRALDLSARTIDLLSVVGRLADVTGTGALIAKEGRTPPQISQLNGSPVKLKLDMVVKKVVESTYLHVANAGLIGSDEECPKLPEELNWACKDGHNIEAYHMAVLIKNISEASHEIIIQSKHLLTNVVLWMLWHYAGHFRVIVSGKVVFDRVLGPDKRTVECRVAKFCSKDRNTCGGPGSDEMTLFYVMENISGSPHLLFRAQYDAVDDRNRTGLFVRQKLYEWPHRYPKSHASTQARTRATAREVVRWFMKIPVQSAPIDLYPTMVFDVNVAGGNKPSHRGLTVGDLLGRSPQLLNMGSKLDRPFVVFSDDNPEDSDRRPGRMIGDDTEDHIHAILDFFPILQDLVQEMKESCECHQCQLSSDQGDDSKASSSFNYDTSCLGYLAFSEVMFYFSHAVADAFGSPDASGIPSLKDSLEGDLGAIKVLGDIITDGWKPGQRGTVRWDSMFNAAVRVFLGAQIPPDPRAEYGSGYGFEPDLHRFGSSGVVGSGVPTAVAVQFGSLAVIAPWLDISRPLSCRRSFRFEVVRGRLAICSDQTDGQASLRGLSGDLCVIETQRTEDVSSFNSRSPPEAHEPGTVLNLEADGSEEKWDWTLVPVNETRQKILLRIVSGEHSRMVQPSMAIRQLTRTLEVSTCNHKLTSSARTPNKSLVELDDFGELLGRWGDPVTDEDTDYDSEDEDEDLRPPLPLRKKARTMPTPDSMRKPTQVCASQVLDSSFKFNTALALAGVGPVLVNNEDCCLKCSLKLAIDAKDERRDEKVLVKNPNCRWVIAKKRDPVERLPLTLRNRRAIADGGD